MKGLYGLLGEKLTHSFSPQIHSLIFKELKLDGYYHLFEVDKTKIFEAVEGFKALKVNGINVTIPYKIDVMKYLDEISEEAKGIGAVNTICFKDGKTKGYNTDYYGFGMMLNKFDIKIEGNEAIVLGTGGAAKAVIQYLLDNKASDIILATRNKAEGMTKFKDFKVISYEEINHIKSGGILINSTPVGMYPKIDNSPLPKELVGKFGVVVDLIYNPRETLLIKYAKEQNIKAINGLFMLVGQAVKAEELWNCVKIKEEIVDKIYKEIDSLF